MIYLRVAGRQQPNLQITQAWTASTSSTTNKRYLRTDRPYGTLLSSTPTGTTPTSAMGKTCNGGASPQMARSRGGIWFAIPAGTPEPATLNLTVTINTFANSLETFSPHVYASNTDDSAFGTGWQNNLDVDCGALTYGTTTAQVIAIPTSLITASAGGKLSLLFGEDYELLGTGSGIVANQAATFIIPAQTMTLDLIY